MYLNMPSYYSKYNVPSRTRALTRSQSQQMVGPLKGPKEEKSTGRPLVTLPK